MRVFHLLGAKTGVHAVQSGEGHPLSWCGARSQFRHVVRDGTMDEVTCKKCLKQVAENRPLSWKGR